MNSRLCNKDHKTIKITKQQSVMEHALLVIRIKNESNVQTDGVPFLMVFLTTLLSSPIDNAYHIRTVGMK